MRTEHTTSEVTEQEGLTDAQFFYGEIMKLQKKCYALEQENKELKKELKEELEKAYARYHEKLDRERRFCDALKIIKDYTVAMDNSKVTRKEIISNLQDIAMGISIFAAHWRLNDPHLDFGAIMNQLAERRVENDSTNS